MSCYKFIIKTIFTLFVFIGCGGTPSSFDSNTNVYLNDDQETKTVESIDNNVAIDFRDYLPKYDMEKDLERNIVMKDERENGEFVDVNWSTSWNDKIFVDDNELIYRRTQVDIENPVTKVTKTVVNEDEVEFFSSNEDGTFIQTNSHNRFLYIGDVVTENLAIGDVYADEKFKERLSTLSLNGHTYTGDIIVFYTDVDGEVAATVETHANIYNYYQKDIGFICRFAATYATDMVCMEDDAVTNKNTCVGTSFDYIFYIP